jgi:ankyrin repeat protein
MINSSEENSLHAACLKGDIEAVKSSIAKREDVNAKDHNKLTPLHVACFRGYKDIVELLIENQANVNVSTTESPAVESPLHLACLKNHLEIVKLLLENGADIDAQDKNKQTPLHYAIWANSELIVKLLLENGAYIDAQDKNKQTPLDYAIWANSELYLKKLLDETRQADFDLDSSFRLENIDLLNAGIEVLNSNGLMNRIKHLEKVIEGDAKASHKIETLKLLKQKGFDIYQKNSEGDNMLSLALKKGDGDLIEQIFKQENGFDLEKLSIDAKQKILSIDRKPASCFSCLSAGNILKITFSETRSPPSVEVKLSQEVSSDLKRAFEQAPSVTADIGHVMRP